jgi:hypothetical protein
MVNRTRGFVNQNRFRSSKSAKKLSKLAPEKRQKGAKKWKAG